MRRRAICFVLCAALVLCFAAVLPGQSRAAANLFAAVNDTLPGMQAYYANGTYYLPYSAFNLLGVYFSYFSENSTALLYSGTTKYFFDLQNNNCYDASGNTYAVSAILRGGTVCMPVDFVCPRFGLSWSYISGNEYGDILRVKNSAAVLSDKDFLSAVSPLMRYYAEGKTESAPPASAPPSTPTPTPSPTPTPTPDKSGVRVRLWFIGLPDSAALDLLDASGVQACFFVTAEDIRQNADTLRRAAGSGYKLGALLDPADCAGSLDETRQLLFEAAHVDTVLCAAADGGESACASFAQNQGLAFAVSDLSLSGGLSPVTSALSRRTASADIRIPAGGADTLLQGLLSYLKTNKYDVEPLLEVNAG